MKTRKSFKIKEQRVNVRVTKNKLEIVSTFDDKEVVNLTVNYPTKEEAKNRYDNYDKNNTNSFVCNFKNPYLINK